MRHLPRQWRENAACNEVVSLLSIAFVGVCSIWLWMVYEMEGSSTSMTSIGFIYRSCLVRLTARWLRCMPLAVNHLSIALLKMSYR